MALETEGLNLDLVTVTKGVEAVFNDIHKGQYFVCEKDGKIIASLLTLFEWSDWRNGQVLWIHSVFVDSDFRNQGVFKEMYGYLKEKVEKDPKLFGLRLYVDQSNHLAKKVYENLGMNNDHYSLYEWVQ
ncbi:MAG: GNAT family N-acetyltransferase [Epsilonproteobacteria bacterium]|nr:MAG: GNAT family N-acetyltransferase [Campylobacterota bacterium]RLA64259.1 MAG: GNAT family N-acetyltransferase [Campylobacterota bacterium]